MTRDELIAGTRQLVDEGDRLRANPSLASLQMWLQRSDDLLATAWGSMDRYHLAWLMVGKPKGDRPRPTDDARRGGRLRPRGRRAEDRRAADEPRRGRAPGDAVRRRVGRGRAGRAAGRRAADRGRAARRTARPTAPACRPTRPSPSAWPRPGARPTRTSTTTRRARHAPRGCSGDGRGSDATGRATGTDLVPAVGGTRTVPAPDPIARDYLLLALRLDQHIPGLVDGYFGPADLKAQVDMEQLRSPARLRDDAIALRARLAAEVAEADRRDWLDAQLVALETQAAGLAGETLPYLEHVTRCFAYAPPRYPDDELRGGRGADRRAAPRRRAARGSARGLGRALRRPGRSPAGRRRLARRRASGRAAAADFGLPDGEDLRVSLVTDQPWSAYNWFDGGRRSRVDVNTDLPVRRPDLVGTVAHETYPGHHLEHAWKEADLVDRAGPARVVDPAHQHARVPDQRGPGRPRRAVRRRRRRRAPTCSSSCTSARASRSRPTRPRPARPPN